MEFVNDERLNADIDTIRANYQQKKPFRYVVIENFFYPEKAEQVYQSYPEIKDGKWGGGIYMDQSNKFYKTKFDEGSVMDRLFKELNSPQLLKWLEQVTGIDEILADDELAGGGLHQSIAGAYLNVHVDFNIHPSTKFHRRINLLVYMNKDWKDEYEGHLELWDLTDESNTLLDKIAPHINRCVIFETNEISFHGHPKPLKTPAEINRKSIATYYYTQTRPASEIAEEHSTIYVNTEGVSGQAKRFSTRVKIFLKNINKRI